MGPFLKQINSLILVPKIFTLTYYLNTSKMASLLLKINSQLIKTPNNLTLHQFNPTPTSTSFSYFPSTKKTHLKNPIKTQSLPLQTHSSISSLNPPKSKEEAINQAIASLSSTLAKPLNNLNLSGKLKKAKQPKLRVEIPVIDDSPDSLTQLAREVFDEIPLRKKGSFAKILIFWPNFELTEAGEKSFSNSANLIRHVDISSVGENVVLGSADVAVFLAPEATELDSVKFVTERFCPKPVVIFNPKWGFEEERGFDDLSGFVGLFEVVYSFMGLEVRGILSRKNGVVFKCVRDGILSGEKWNVFVEEDGELKLVTRFGSRPTINEVENVLYNLMAVNSPITKSAKFLKGLVSNVTGKK